MAAPSPFLPSEKIIQPSEYYKAWDRKVILDTFSCYLITKWRTALLYSKSTATHATDL